MKSNHQETGRGRHTGSKNYNFVRFSGRETEAANPAANVVCLQAQRLKNLLDATETIKTRAGQIEDLIEEASSEDYQVENWNGYNSKPLNAQSIEFARQFLNSLPEDIMLPDIDPNPNGLLGLYWNRDGYQLLLDINQSGTISYAFKSDFGLAYTGRPSFFSAIPKRLQSLLTDFFTS